MALFDPRTLSFIAPADDVVYVGDEVRLEYAPASDDFVPNPDGSVGIASPWWIQPHHPRRRHVLVRGQRDPVRAGRPRG